MNEITNKLIQYLTTEYAETGFSPISVELDDLPNRMSWIGGIERKTLNLHRAICIVGYSGDEESLDTVVIELKENIRKSLRARFWQGIGVGLIIFSETLMGNEVLQNLVYSGQKVSTCLIQWIINLTNDSNTATIAHTFSEVSTSFMVNELLDFLEIPVEKRIVIVSEQPSLLKMKLN